MPNSNSDGVIRGIPTLVNALDWTDWERAVEAAAADRGVLQNLRNGRAGNAIGAIPGGDRGLQRWRDLKRVIIESLGQDPGEWLKNQDALDVPLANAADIVNALENEGYDELGEDDQRIENKNLLSDKFLNNAGVVQADIRSHITGLKRRIARLPSIYVPRPGAAAGEEFNSHLLKLLRSSLPPSFGLSLQLLQTAQLRDYADVTLANICSTLVARMSELVAEGKYTVTKGVAMVSRNGNVEDFGFLTTLGGSGPNQAASADNQSGRVMISKSALKNKLKRARLAGASAALQGGSGSAFSSSFGGGSSSLGGGSSFGGFGPGSSYGPTSDFSFQSNFKGSNSKGTGFNNNQGQTSFSNNNHNANRYHNQNNSTPTYTCRNCGGVGHFARECPSRSLSSKGNPTKGRGAQRDGPFNRGFAGHKGGPGATGKQDGKGGFSGGKGAGAGGGSKGRRGKGFVGFEGGQFSQEGNW